MGGRFPFIVGIKTSHTTEIAIVFGIGTCIIGDYWGITGITGI
jgi:hypothetical protein